MQSSRMALETRRRCVCGEPALRFCHDCDVSYCEQCSAKRHRKGAFVRHQLALIVIVTRSTTYNNNNNNNNHNKQDSTSNQENQLEHDQSRGLNDHGAWDASSATKSHKRRTTGRRQQQEDHLDLDLDLDLDDGDDDRDDDGDDDAYYAHGRDHHEEEFQLLQDDSTRDHVQLLPMCDECMEHKAVLVCRSCELNLCGDCSKEIHRFGRLLTHLETNQLELFTTNSPATDIIHGFRFEALSRASRGSMVCNNQAEQFVPAEQPQQQQQEHQQMQHESAGTLLDPRQSRQTLEIDRPKVARHAGFAIMEDNQQHQPPQQSLYFKPILDDDQLVVVKRKSSPRRKLSESDAYELWSHWSARTFVQRSASLDEWPTESRSPSKDLSMLTSISKSLGDLHVASSLSNNVEPPSPSTSSLRSEDRTSFVSYASLVSPPQTDDDDAIHPDDKLDQQPPAPPSSGATGSATTTTTSCQPASDGNNHHTDCKSPPAAPTTTSSALNPGDMDALFHQLATDFASRHVILRSRERNKQLDGSAIRHHLESLGDIAVFRDEFVKEGLLVVTFFELKSAVDAMKTYTSFLRQATSRRTSSIDTPSDATRLDKEVVEPDVITRFCAPFELPNAQNSGSLVVKIHGCAISSEEMRTFCSRFGEVASVLQNDLYSSDYIVEYNDLRHLPDAMAALANAKHPNGAILVSRPQPSALDLKRIHFFQDCLDSLAVLSPVLDDVDVAETSTGRANRSQSYSSMRTSPTSSASDGSFIFDGVTIDAATTIGIGSGNASTTGRSSSTSSASPFNGNVFSTVNTSPLLASLSGDGSSASSQKIWSGPSSSSEPPASTSKGTTPSSQERNTSSCSSTESSTSFAFPDAGSMPTTYENAYRSHFQPNHAATLYTNATYMGTTNVSHMHAQNQLLAHAGNIHSHSSQLPPYHNQRTMVAGQVPVRFPTFALRSASEPSFRTSSPGMTCGGTTAGMNPSMMHLGASHPGANCMTSSLGVGLHASGSASLYHTSGGRNDQGVGEYSLSIERVCSGEDKRTTLMIRNIPNKYTQQMLLAEINQHHNGLYDFFYLPIDFKNKCNMGYAFINFVECDSIVSFYQEFNNQKWTNFNSEKVCAISYARLQGKQAMITRFQNSSLLEKHESYRPLVFGSSGTNRGKPEPFPSPKQQLKKHPSFGHSSSASTGFPSGLEYSSSPLRGSSGMLHGAPMNMTVGVPPQHLQQHHPPHHHHHQLGGQPLQQQQHVHVPTGPMTYHPSLHHGVYQENAPPGDSTMAYGSISPGYLY